MKIEQGFVAATPDGQYLRWWKVSTHIGYRTEFGTTINIDDAGFSLYAHDRGFDRDARHAAPPHTWVPAERRVEVVLTGWGVK